MQDTKLDLDNDLLELDTSPNLTLSLEPEPEINLTPAPAPVDSAALAEIQQEEQKLDEKERKMVDEFAAKIDIGNVQQILQYGASAQKKVGDFSETALSNVTNKTKDLGEVGEMITDLVMELKGFDVNEEPKGIFGLFKRSADNLERLKLRLC